MRTSGWFTLVPLVVLSVTACDDGSRVGERATTALVTARDACLMFQSAFTGPGESSESERVARLGRAADLAERASDGDSRWQDLARATRRFDDLFIGIGERPPADPQDPTVSQAFETTIKDVRRACRPAEESAPPASRAPDETPPDNEGVGEVPAVPGTCGSVDGQASPFPCDLPGPVPSGLRTERPRPVPTR